MKMNHWVPAVAAVVMLAGSLSGGGAATAAAKSQPKADMPIKLLYNARQLPSDVQPESVNGTTLVPLRVVSDKLGGKLTLTGKKISIVKGKSTLALTIGESAATINGKTTKLPVPVKVVKGRTLVPLRVVSEGLGVAVEWDNVSRFVWIGSRTVPKLEDVLKAVDIKPYLDYFKGKQGQLIINDGFSPKKTTARIIEEMDFPLEIAGDIYYRMDLAYFNGEEVTRSVTNDKGVMGRSFYVLEKGMPARARSEFSGIRESMGDFRIHYNRMVTQNDEINFGIKDYKSFRIKQAAFIGIFAPSDSVILVDNYFAH
ncbi:copper amine oxidase N-terminal domain-containing protein [Paenibacillus lycopersici]|uniref:Copper amine oxidase N-terminal domain-containing protein n=1 Tax=Paenibacillus lycopersici TaxID=2704462 RepID=A0A6C0FZQ7_9BACL|nr:copper amine oxidase N-terminal domain-containing protein [Paenibacillus lycopersici]QHT62618.1 copper amine oxidase N-terminal domain-containing protein [Paenibacillus lycopersici]